MPEVSTAETRTGMGMGIEIRSSAPHHSRWKRVFDALDFFFRASPSWHTFGEWVNVDTLFSLLPRRALACILHSLL